MSNVLIVDDSVYMRMVLKVMLEKNGFTVIGEANDGREAVRKYQELNPDIVTLDITMPGMDGLKALKHIKAINAKAKVVMVSALGQKSVIMEAIIAGANSFVTKPFYEQEVLDTLNKL